jgi:hypothetical protein
VLPGDPSISERVAFVVVAFTLVVREWEAMTQVIESLVGQWAGTVTYGPKVQEFTFTFDDDGSATLVTTETTGHGKWVATGEDSFDIAMRETLNFGDSGVSGETVVTGIDHLVVAISAKLEGSTFAGSGTAEVFDKEGTTIFLIDAFIDAERVQS